MTDIQTSQSPGQQPRRRLLHPFSGLTIFGLDWLLFGSNLLSGGALTILWSTLGFVIGAVAVAIIQKRLQQDVTSASVWKGVLAGIAVGIPFPIAGTALGALILTLSGLDRFRSTK
jgi:hypothetical protein